MYKNCFVVSVFVAFVAFVVFAILSFCCFVVLLFCLLCISHVSQRNQLDAVRERIGIGAIGRCQTAANANAAQIRIVQRVAVKGCVVVETGISRQVLIVVRDCEETSRMECGGQMAFKK